MEIQVQTAPPKKHRFVSSDITGKKYGRLTALYPTKKRDAKGYVIWHCLCDCGTETDISYNDLLYTQVQSCGCQKREHNKKLGTYEKFEEAAEARRGLRSSFSMDLLNSTRDGKPRLKPIPSRLNQTQYR